MPAAVSDRGHDAQTIREYGSRAYHEEDPVPAALPNHGHHALPHLMIYRYARSSFAQLIHDGEIYLGRCAK